MVPNFYKPKDHWGKNWNHRGPHKTPKTHPPHTKKNTIKFVIVGDLLGYQEDFVICPLYWPRRNISRVRDPQTTSKGSQSNLFFFFFETLWTSSQGLLDHLWSVDHKLGTSSPVWTSSVKHPCKWWSHVTSHNASLWPMEWCCHLPLGQLAGQDEVALVNCRWRHQWFFINGPVGFANVSTKWRAQKKSAWSTWRSEIWSGKGAFRCSSSLALLPQRFTGTCDSSIFVCL